MAIELTAEQRAAVENRGGTLLVSAAAGSGKTRVLVERLMDHVIREKQNIDQFLVITFTKAAAAELRSRVAQALSERLALTPQDGHLRRQTALVYQAKICTIDSFCIDLIRECGHLADIDPDFRVCEEAETSAFLASALNGVLERFYNELDPGFLELVDALAGERDDRTLEDVVLDIRRRIQSHPDPSRWLRERQKDFDWPLDARPEDTPWGQILLKDASEQALYWASEAEAALDEASDDEIVYQNYSKNLTKMAEYFKNLSVACWDGWDAAVSHCKLSLPRAGSKRGGDPDIKESVKERYHQCKKQAERISQRFEVTAAEAMEDLRALRPSMTALLNVVEALDQAFGEEKRRRRLLDFSDGEHLAMSLLANPDGTPTELAQEWRERFVEIMVDEFQDTNEVQNALFQALSRDGKNLFLVGDVKQSIYRFRQADPGIFLEKYNIYPPWQEAGEGEARKTALSQNFRSRPEVLEGTNFVFRSIMSSQMGELDYTGDQSLHPGRTGWEPDANAQVELNVIDLRSAAGENDREEGEWTEKVEKPLIQARAVARRASEYLNGGLTIQEGGRRRPVRPEDMVVLLRSPRPVLREYAQAFDEAGIAWSADGGEEFFETTEIHVALSLLQVIDNPHQDIPLLGVLRAPVFDFGPERLAVLRSEAREGDFYEAVQAAAGRGEEDCVLFLNLLNRFRSLAGEVSSHQLIWELYGQLNLPAVFGAMEGGERRKANLMALYDSAVRFENGGHKGLSGFLAHITRMIENEQTISPVKEERGGIKIMSIHQSKGLEFPVVFLCGLDRQFNDQDQRATILFHPRLGLGPKRIDRARRLRYTTIARDADALELKRESRAEEMRLLYVAMTRAEQKLVLFTTVNGRLDKLTELARQANSPVHPRALLNCKSPAGWLLMGVLCRPEAEELRELAQASPNLCGPGEYEWDIRVLEGADYEKALSHRVSSRQAEPEQEPSEEAVAKLAAVLTWQYPHRASVEIASKLTATQLKGRARDEEASENAAPAQRRPSVLARPRFTQEELGLTPVQKGIALHQAMQFIDYSRANTVEGVQKELERLVAKNFITPVQGEAVDPAVIVQFFRSALGRRLLAAPRVEREFKFSLLVPAKDYYPEGEEGEQVLLQGVADCWFEDAEGVTVIDFKTDSVSAATVGERAAHYGPQLAAYSLALEQVLGKPVAQKVLWFFRLGRGIEV